MVISLSYERQDLALTELTALLEQRGDLSDFASVDDREESCTVEKLVLLKWDAFLYLSF